MERTLFKAAIVDPEFKNVMANLSIMSPTPSLEKCKSEVRKHGAKLAKERKARAHHTYIRDEYLEYPDYSDELTEDDIRVVAAVMNRNRGNRGYQGRQQQRRSNSRQPDYITRSPDQPKDNLHLLGRVWNEMTAKQ